MTVGELMDYLENCLQRMRVVTGNLEDIVVFDDVVIPQGSDKAEPVLIIDRDDGAKP